MGDPGSLAAGVLALLPMASTQQVLLPIWHALLWCRPPARALGHCLPSHPRGVIFGLVRSRVRDLTKKKTDLSLSLCFKGISMEAMSENKMVPSDFSTGPMEKAAKPLPFKDPNFVVSF